MQNLKYRNLFGRQESGQVGSSRYKSGKSGQFSHRWTFLFGFAHASSVSMLGHRKKANGHIIDSQRLSLAFRVPASGSHVFLRMVRSQQCLFVFRYRAIITPFLVQFPWGAASFLVTTPPWQSFSIPEQAMRRVSHFILFTLRSLNSVHFTWKASLQALDRSFLYFTDSIARTLSLCDNLCGCACPAHYTPIGRIAAVRPFRQPLRFAHCPAFTPCTCASHASSCLWF